MDTLSIVKILNFHLSWSWNQDLYREMLVELSPELGEMVEEIFPFTSEYSHNLVTIMSEEDAKQHGFYSETSLLDRKPKSATDD